MHSFIKCCKSQMRNEETLFPPPIFCRSCACSSPNLTLRSAWQEDLRIFLHLYRLPHTPALVLTELRKTNSVILPYLTYRSWGVCVHCLCLFLMTISSPLLACWDRCSLYFNFHITPFVMCSFFSLISLHLLPAWSANTLFKSREKTSGDNDWGKDVYGV